jgi:hypothetical protein
MKTECIEWLEDQSDQVVRDVLIDIIVSDNVDKYS